MPMSLLKGEFKVARSKKDIDKELMYIKILPTSVAAEPPVSRPEPEEPAVVPKTAPPPVVAFQPEPAPAPKEEPAAVVIEEPVAEPVVAAPPAPEKEMQQPINLMEGFVESRIDEAMKKFNCCTCDKCRRDIMALALNKLQPFYVIEEDIYIRDEKEKERAADVATALVQAILTVKANPIHD